MSRSRSHTNSLFHCLSGAYALSSPGAPNRLGDVLHRLMYRVVALGGGRIQARLLRRMFDLHHREPDRWSYETSSYDRERFTAVLRGIGPGPYERVLEVGCSEGVFTRALASDDRVGAVTAADVSLRALETARRRCEGLSNVSFVSGSVVNEAPPGPFDLIICSEMLYYVGGRRAAVARELVKRLAPGGILVLEHVHPESGRLHASFIHSAGLEVLERTVVRHSIRPFEVLALRRPA